MNLELLFLIMMGLVAGCLSAAFNRARVNDERSAMSYLKKYGYMTSSDMDGGMPRTNAIKEQAIRWFQMRANMNVTGVLDAASLDMMNVKRCGLPDMSSESDMMRKKRYALYGLKWPQSVVTYRIESRTPDLPDDAVDKILGDALQIWSEVSGLTFTEVVSTAQDADILINFYYGDHGDGDGFDGEGGVLAHAYFPSISNPIGGDAHFDEDEYYTDNTYDGTNLFQVAAHEFGHSLGLEHSDVADALMYPYYRGYIPDYQLNDDDIQGIQALYGENVGKPDEMETASTPVGNCMTEISLAMRTGDGNTYLANDTHVFRLMNDVVQPGYPKRIGDEFPGLPENLDAAFYYPPSGYTYVFKGADYWVLSNQTIVTGYPQLIASTFQDLPNDLDAAFIWSGNGGLYFTKGDQYYRFSRSSVVQGYPRSLSAWAGLPSDGVDAALQDHNSRTYFFAGSDYYRFDDEAGQVEDTYPRTTAVWWLACSEEEVEAAARTAAPGVNPTTVRAAATATVPSVAAVMLSLVGALFYV